MIPMRIIHEMIRKTLFLVNKPITLPSFSLSVHTQRLLNYGFIMSHKTSYQILNVVNPHFPDGTPN